MPLSQAIKDELELEIKDTFSSVNVLGYPFVEGNQTSLSCLVIHPDQLNEAMIREIETSKPAICISYPVEDSNPPKRFGSWILPNATKLNLDFTQADEVPDSFLNTLVTDITQDFTITEPNIEAMEIYTGVDPLDSTSWARVEVRVKSTGKFLGAYNLRNLEIARGGWTRFDLNIDYVDEFWSETLTVRIMEFQEFGTNPNGINIYHNAAGEVLIRTYARSIVKREGKLANSFMRFEIYSKNKDEGIDNDEEIFVAKERIATQIADQIREYIIQNWTFDKVGVSVHELGSCVASNEFFESEYLAKEQFDAVLLYEEYIETELFPLKRISIQKIVKS